MHIKQYYASSNILKRCFLVIFGMSTHPFQHTISNRVTCIHIDRESYEDTLSDGIVLGGMFEDGMSLRTFEKALQWLYTGSREYVEASDSEVTMELICMANLLGLVSLMRVCELQLSSIVSNSPLLAETCLDFAER